METPESVAGFEVIANSIPSSHKEKARIAGYIGRNVERLRSPTQQITEPF